MQTKLTVNKHALTKLQNKKERFLRRTTSPKIRVLGEPDLDSAATASVDPEDQEVRVHLRVPFAVVAG